MSSKFIEFKGMPIPKNKDGFPVRISKVARHGLAILCWNSIKNELLSKGIPEKKGRGRKPKTATLIANSFSSKMSVHIESVIRWIDPNEVACNDYHAEKLAELAYQYDPDETREILRADVARQSYEVDRWLHKQDNSVVSPYPKIQREVVA